MSKTWTMMQRLQAKSDKHLEFEYMGKAEYEFGTASAALGVFTTDLPVPKETIPTNIVLTRETTPLNDMTGPRRRETKKAYAERLKDYDHIEAMLDGQPLLLRYVPGITASEGLDEVMKMTGFENVINPGGLMTRDTHAWLTIAPVVGILYHPSQEERVNLWLDRLSGLRADKEPDAEVRARTALTKVQTLTGHGEHEAVDLEAVKSVMQSLSDTLRP